MAHLSKVIGFLSNNQESVSYYTYRVCSEIFLLVSFGLYSAG